MNIKKYILFTIISLISFIGITFADNVDFSLKHGESYSIGLNGYTSVTCRADGELKALTLEQTNNVTTPYIIHFNKFPDEDGSDSITCTWSNRLLIGKQETDEKTITIYYSKVQESISQINIVVNGGTEKINEEINVFASLGTNVKRIISVNQEKDGNEYVTLRECSAGGNTCRAQITEAAINAHETLKNVVHIEYVDVNGVQRTVDINFLISITGGAKAWIGGYGTCSFDTSKWQLRANYYESKTSDAVLPSCNSNNNQTPLPLEFKGWTSVADSAELQALNRTPQTIGACANFNLVGAGSTAQNGLNYFPCFETAPAVALSTPSGTINVNTTSCKKYGNEQSYVCTGTGNFTLPAVILNGKFDADNSFAGWSKDGGKTILQPGTSVPYDGSTYNAIINRTVIERDYRKSVYVDQKDTLYVDGMTACSANSSGYLTAVYSNGECLITGLKATPDKVYVDVTVKAQNNDGATKTLTYKFDVLGQGTPSEAGAGGFKIDIDTNTVAGTNEVYGLNDVAVSNQANDIQDIQGAICKNLKISQDNNDAFHFATPVTGDNSLWAGLSTVDGGMMARKYEVKTTCGDNAQYLSLCMDPGRIGPGDDGTGNTHSQDVDYYITNDLQTHPELRKLMIYIIKNYLNTEEAVANFNNKDKNRVAAQLAVRIITMIYDPPTENQKNDSSYNTYWGLAKAVKDAYDKYSAGSNNLKTQITNIFSASNIKLDCAEYNNDEFRNEMIDILTNYQTLSVDEKEDKFERVIDTTNITAHADGRGYTVDYEGTFKLPSNMTFDSSSHKPGDVVYTKNGVVGKLISFSKNTNQSTTEREVWDYHFQIDVDLTVFKGVPKSADEKREYSLILKYKGGINLNNIYIAYPYSPNDTWQRMLVFDLSNRDLYVYFDIAPNSRSICMDLDILDSKNCTDDDNCSLPNFNKEAFVELGCCNFELDDTSYVSQNICSSKCTSSTFSNVCKIDFVNSGSAEMYSIKEGTKYSGSGFKDNIGTCIVDVKDDFAVDRANGDVSKYQKADDRGNTIMVSSYKDNAYCQVSCREEWDITMNSFGNFVGEKAVRAGMSFQNADNDIFIGKKETCYTTYIDYDKYVDDAVEESQNIVELYNQYSKAAHAWSDIELQVDSSSEGFTSRPVSRCDGEYSYTICDYGEPDEETGNCMNADGEIVAGKTGYACNHWITEDKYIYTLATLDTKSDFQGVSGKWRTSSMLPYQEPKGSYLEYAVNVSRYPNDPYIVVSGTSDSGYHTQQSTTCTLYSDEIDGVTHATQHYGDDCYDANHKEEAFEYLKGAIKGAQEGIMATAHTKITNAINNIKDYTNNMYACQHFELSNKTDAEDSQKENSTIHGDNLFGRFTAFTQIDSTFDPYVSYEYDEVAYMTILQKDNILVEHTDMNNDYMPDYNKQTNIEVDAFVSQGTTQIPVTLSRNKVETSYYNPSTMWMDGSTYAKNYEDSTNRFTYSDGVINISDRTNNYERKKIVLCEIGSNNYGDSNFNSRDNDIILDVGATAPPWQGGGCYEYNLEYIKAHYVKSSLANSSFYRNKGIWYMGPNDTREHGDTLKEAWANASKRTGGPSYANEDPRNWSLFYGTLGYDGDIKYNYNVFPVSITTPRNLYEYTYRFAQIGDYFDKNETGRVMGKGASSIISVNSRTCFYEVVEDICLCCGDPLVTYTYDNPNVEETITPEEFIQDNDGYDYKMSSGSGSGGVLGFSTSTVSLSDLNTSSDRQLGGNWTNKAAFYYAGAKLSTNKGAVALKEIEQQGEEVYANDAEYSYILKPAALAAIRDYNDTYGYGVNFDTLTIYGRSSIQPVGTCASSPENCHWTTSDETTMNNYVANFNHYGSKFLEDFNDILNLDYNAFGGYTNLTSYDNVCVLVRDDNEDNVVRQLNNLKGKGCRWVDYIEVVDDSVATLLNPTGSNPNNQYGGNQYFRLAFK